MKEKFEKKLMLNPRRVFSVQIRKQTVRDIEAGKCSVFQASRELTVTPTAIYKWIHRYSRYLKSSKLMVVEDKSEAYRSQELAKEVKELQAALGRKQMEIDLLNKIIELASNEFQTDIKKNLQSPPLLNSKPSKLIDPDTK